MSTVTTTTVRSVPGLTDNDNETGRPQAAKGTGRAECVLGQVFSNRVEPALSGDEVETAIRRRNQRDSFMLRPGTAGFQRAPLGAGRDPENLTP